MRLRRGGKPLALCVMVLILLGLLPTQGQAAADFLPPERAHYESGQLVLSKSAVRAGPDLWDVTMQVQTRAVRIQPRPLEVVFVLNTSGSMAWCAGGAGHEHAKACYLRCTEAAKPDHYDWQGKHRTGDTPDCMWLSTGWGSGYYRYLTCGRAEHRHVSGVPCDRVGPDAPDRLGVARAAIGQMAAALKGTVSVHYVSFSDTASSHSGGYPAQITPSGGANLRAGAEEGLLQFSRQAASRKILVLVTDGDGTDETNLGPFQAAGGTVYTVGFPSGGAELEALASEGCYLLASDLAGLGQAMEDVVEEIGPMLTEAVGEAFTLVGGAAGVECQGVSGTVGVSPAGDALWWSPDAPLEEDSGVTLRYRLALRDGAKTVGVHENVLLDGGTALRYSVVGETGDLAQALFPTPVADYEVASMEVEYRDEEGRDLAGLIAPQGGTQQVIVDYGDGPVFSRTAAPRTAALDSNRSYVYAASTYDGGPIENSAAAIPATGGVHRLIHTYRLATFQTVDYQYAGQVPPLAQAQLPPPRAYERGAVNLPVAPAPRVHGYAFSGWSTEDAAMVDGYFDLPDRDVTFTGSFAAAPQFTVSYLLDGSPYGTDARYFAGDTVTCLPVPEKPGHSFEGWTSADVSLGGEGFEMPGRDVVLVGVFTPIVYEIKTALTGGGGTIDPLNDGIQGIGGTICAGYGDTVTVCWTLREGYEVASVTVNGTPLSPDALPEGNCYTFSDLSDHGTLQVDTREKTHSVTGQIDHGTIQGNGSYRQGEAATILWSPDEGRLADGLTVDGAPVPLAEGQSSYHFPAVDAPHHVAVTTRWKTYTVTWLDRAGQELKKLEGVPHGQAVAEADRPTDPEGYSDEVNHYAFTGWRRVSGTGDCSSVTDHLVFQETFAPESPVLYTVRFLEEDGATVISTAQYPFGAELQVPDPPAKVPTVEQTFTFLHWVDGEGNEVAGFLPVAAGADYRAVYSAAPRRYDVTFQITNWPGGTRTVDTQQVPYGADAVLPAFAPPAGWHAMDDWSDYRAITSPRTVSGTIGRDYYAIVYRDWDGTVLEGLGGRAEHGTPFSLSTHRPLRPADHQYRYTFSGWAAEGSDGWLTATEVTESMAFRATYTAVLQNYAITYVKGEGGNFADYGKNADYGAPTPAFGGITGPDGGPLGLPGYTFDQWWPQVSATVTGPATYEARWTANPDTPYTAQLWYEQPDGSYRQDGGAIPLTGTTGQTVTLSVEQLVPQLDRQTYTLNEAESRLDGTVAGDGTLVLKLVFDRRAYQVRYTVDGQDAGADFFPVGAEVTLRPVPQRTGYHFGGWRPAVLPDFMPAGDLAVAGDFVLERYPFTVSYTFTDGSTHPGFDRVGSSIPYGMDYRAEARPAPDGYRLTETKISGAAGLSGPMPAGGVEVEFFYAPVGGGEPEADTPSSPPPVLPPDAVLPSVTPVAPTEPAVSLPEAEASVPMVPPNPETELNEEETPLGRAQEDRQAATSVVAHPVGNLPQTGPVPQRNCLAALGWLWVLVAVAFVIPRTGRHRGEDTTDQ